MLTRPMSMLIAALLTTSLSAQVVKLTYNTKLEAAYRQPVRLMPGGKQILFYQPVHNADPRKHAYFIADIDGTNKRKLYESTVDIDDILAFSIGRGFVSPSGRKIAVMTTHNGQPLRNNGGGKPVISVVDAQGNQITKLQTEVGMITSAVFADESSVIFTDHSDPNVARTDLQTKMNKIDLKTGKVSTLHHFKNELVTCLQRSPDGKFVAGVGVRFHPNNASRISIALVALNLNDGSLVVAEPQGRLHDGFYDEAFWLVWSGDSKRAYTVLLA